MKYVLPIFIVLAVAVTVFADREEQILQQSDDTREGSYICELFRFAQWFEAPVDCHIVSASYYVNTSGTQLVGVWADNPYLDLPGDVLGSFEHSFAVGASWVWSEYVDLTHLGVTMSSGDRFWVGIDYNDMDTPFFGWDSTNPDHGLAYSWQPGGWDWDPARDLMVRVKIDDDFDPPYVDEQDPADGETGVDPAADIIFHCKDGDYGVDSDTIEFTADDGTKADIPGTLDVDDTDPNDVLCTFSPHSDLPAGATITCTVDGELADGLGNEMGEDEVWTFTVTGSSVGEASLGEIKATYQ
ncbi:MAG: Ig-like domain-containing protein [Candidatus Coatesbacteria bacterium]|nr:MAG: Ig-like domain-containing protein [Candidatus Coatesbacteria bacterium]